LEKIIHAVLGSMAGIIFIVQKYIKNGCHAYIEWLEFNGTDYVLILIL